MEKTYISSATGVFKDNASLLNCIQQQYNTLISEYALFNKLEENQQKLNSKSSKKSGGCLSAILVFLSVMGGLNIICFIFNVLFEGKKASVLEAIILIIYSLLLALPVVIHFYYSVPKNEKKEEENNRILSEEASNICETLWAIYDEKCFKGIPFEYSMPNMLQRLYEVAEKYKLTSVSDTINTLIREDHMRKIDELENNTRAIENCCFKTMQFYAIKRLVGPRKTDIRIHY